mmetsp:Transcript_40340/g.78519  ORF Transcript_40340/g.78519 Transcript_40340/m.78519 type:complete len:105 (+) Transcript_40340:275-589(+)
MPAYPTPPVGHIYPPTQPPMESMEKRKTKPNQLNQQQLIKKEIKTTNHKKMNPITHGRTRYDTHARFIAFWLLPFESFPSTTKFLGYFLFFYTYKARIRAHVHT